jgi:DNA repair protein SbcD/Mre11
MLRAEPDVRPCRYAVEVRIVHTSDWHLGRTLGDWSLGEDQAHVLDQIFAVCREERAHALVVSGDLYDRSTPPPEAVELLSGFVERLVRDLGIPFIAISGNHDSPERLGFAANVLARGKVNILTSLERRCEPVVVETRRERIRIFGLPYLEPEVARHRLGDPNLTTHDASIGAALQAMRAARAEHAGDPAILLAHLFAQGGIESVHSERALVAGGVPLVSASQLDGWSYVALGHLHRPQRVSQRDDIRYSGSPLAYYFGEGPKSVALVDFVMGRAAVRALPLTAKRPLVQLEGTFDELLRADRFDEHSQSFVEATYTDTGYVVDAPARLRQRFPWLVKVAPRELLRSASGEPRRLEVPSTGRELLESFWRHVEPDAPDADAIAAFEQTLEAVCARVS